MNAIFPRGWTVAQKIGSGFFFGAQLAESYNLDDGSFFGRSHQRKYSETVSHFFQVVLQQ